MPAAAAENVKTKHRPQLVLPKFVAVRMKIMTEVNKLAFCRCLYLKNIFQVCEKRKRQRLQPTHRWTDAETADLLNTVLEEVKDNPESLEVC